MKSSSVLYKGQNIGSSGITSNIQADSTDNLVGALGKFSKTSGIPRSSSSPFNVPMPNVKRNNQRFLQIMSILRQYVELTFQGSEPSTRDAFTDIFTFLDNAYNSLDPKSFCDIVGIFGN